MRFNDTFITVQFNFGIGNIHLTNADLLQLLWYYSHCRVITIYMSTNVLGRQGHRGTTVARLTNGCSQIALLPAFMVCYAKSDGQ